MSVTPRGWCKATVEGSSHPLETVARFIARRISLLITVLILHVLSDFYNRLLVTPRRVPTKVTTVHCYFVVTRIQLRSNPRILTRWQLDV